MRYANKYAAASVLLLAAAVFVSPSAAFAHGKNERGVNMDMRGANSLGVKLLGGNVGGVVDGLTYHGSVSAVSGTGFTMQAKNNATFTINTSSAKIVRLPNTVIALSDILVGDSVSVFGTKGSGNNVDASVVFALKANTRPATAKGTVTSNTGGVLNIQTKKNSNVTVNTNANTQVTKQNGQAGVVADATVGSKVTLSGLWDGVLNVFSAWKIKVK